MQMFREIEELHNKLCKPGMLDALREQAEPESVGELLDILTKAIRKGTDRWSLASVLYGLKYFESLVYFVVAEGGTLEELLSDES